MKQLILPEQRFLGSDALKLAFDSICNGRKKAFIITGSSMIRQGHVEGLRSKLSEHGVDSAVYSGVTSEPTDQMVEAGVKLYLSKNCDFIIGFGGGSQLDAAKAIGAMIVHPGKISDYNGKAFEKELPFLVEIPSTAGTGSEATKVTIITDTENDVKMLLKGDVLLPKIAVVDPIYTLQVPASVTAWTGLDALTHAIEAYTSKHAFAACDEYAMSAIKRIFTYLPQVYVDGENYQAREEMSKAAFEAGVTICNSTVTIVHGMSRPIGAMFHVPHGLSNAMLLKDCLSFAMDGAMERFAELGRCIGVAQITDANTVAAMRFIEAVEKLCHTLRVPTLAEYGISRNEFEVAISKMSEDAYASGSPSNTRKEVTVTDMETIYQGLWK